MSKATAIKEAIEAREFWVNKNNLNSLTPGDCESQVESSRGRCLKWGGDASSSYTQWTLPKLEHSWPTPESENSPFDTTGVIYEFFNQLRNKTIKENR